MTFDLISGLHMQIQTWHPPLWLCTHAKYYVKIGLPNVLKNANKTKNMHLFSIWIANYEANHLKLVHLKSRQSETSLNKQNYKWIAFCGIFNIVEKNVTFGNEDTFTLASSVQEVLVILK